MSGLRFQAECNFGNLEDKRVTITKINERCLEMVESVCSGPDTIHAFLIERLIKDSPGPDSHTFKHFSRSLLYEYN